MSKPLIQRCTVCLSIGEIVARSGNRKICKGCTQQMERSAQRRSTPPSAPPKGATTMPTHEKPMSIRPKINAILTRIENAGSLPMPTMRAICEEAGAHPNYISTDSELKERYHDIRRILLARAGNPPTFQQIADQEQELDASIKEDGIDDATDLPAPQPSAAQVEAQRLQQRLAELEQENAELKEKLANPPMQPSPLKGAIAQLQANIEAWEAELRQIDEDRAVLTRNLQAAYRYRSALTGDEPPAQFEWVYVDQAYVPNGKHPVEVTG